MEKFLKYLITISLFFSVFSLSGNTENSYSSKTLANQTELLIVKKQKSSNRIVSYKKTIAVKIRLQLFNSSIDRKQSLISFSRLIKVKFNTISKHLNTLEITNRFLQIKTVPQSFKEVFIATHLG